ncbi:MAG: DUF5615 family PIN-like protein [Chloroflexota bacterium]
MLLDEDLPRQLKREIIGHDVATVRELRWNGIVNGDLLRLASSLFAVFLTCDRNMQYQQNLANIGIAIVVLAVPRNSIVAIRPIVSDILSALSSSLEPGTAIVVGSWRVP